MLRTKLFRGFALVVVLFAVLSIVVGVRTIKKRVYDEAQSRVRLDLQSAWAIYDAKLDDISMVLRLVAGKQLVLEVCAGEQWKDPEIKMRLQRIRAQFDLDFLDILSPDGCVMMRTTPPFAAGDYRTTDPAVASALKGEPRACMTLLSRIELEREAEGLAEKAYMEIGATPQARKSPKTEEARGMVMVAAVPVLKGQTVIGVVYGGVLVNRNHQLVDRLTDVLYRGEEYKGDAIGTATIFLHDTRIATTVREANGNRALGTRVSKEVADTVLDNGRPWVGEAFVVNDWYLTAYEPIRDGFEEIIGMLYVGILKKPFEDYGREVVVNYLLLTLFVTAVALVGAFLMANRLSEPIHRLVEAANHMRRGERPGPVPCNRACNETVHLIAAFNSMATTLADREDKLVALNKSYMDMLGFVSHELKSPVASMTNYAYLLSEQKLGPLTEKQEKAINSIDRGCRRLVEMVRHYLNLSRIENSEFSPIKGRVVFNAEILNPLLESLESEIEAHKVRVFKDVDDGVVLHADAGMVREVFENLLSNALKYGKQDGRIDISARKQDDFWLFTIRNEGKGIPAEKLISLFQKFSRLETAGGRGHDRGTGLGLFITRQIVETHGGRIEARSEEGAWAEFAFSLPRYMETKPEEKADV